MSKNFQMKVQAWNSKVNIEMFNSAAEVVEVNRRRKLTSNQFHDIQKESAAGELCKGWEGVDSLEEAYGLMEGGYQPTVDALKEHLKPNMGGQGKRISFFNDVVGYAPIVPLALMGVPASMQNSYMKPIKAKVIDVYYDMTASSSTKKDDIIKAGQQLLSNLIELEMSGYKFNLYAIQTYYGGKSADMLCTKIKSSNTPLDLKRISFPLTHTAYFRVIGFDWYSKTPKGTFRSGYGKGLGYEFDNKQMQAGFQEIFGKNCVVFSCAKVVKNIGGDPDHFKNIILTGGKGAE